MKRIFSYTLGGVILAAIIIAMIPKGEPSVGFAGDYEATPSPGSGFNPAKATKLRLTLLREGQFILQGTDKGTIRGRWAPAADRVILSSLAGWGDFGPDSGRNVYLGGPGGTLVSPSCRVVWRKREWR